MVGFGHVDDMQYGIEMEMRRERRGGIANMKCRCIFGWWRQRLVLLQSTTNHILRTIPLFSSRWNQSAVSHVRPAQHLISREILGKTTIALDDLSLCMFVDPHKSPFVSLQLLIYASANRDWHVLSPSSKALSAGVSQRWSNEVLPWGNDRHPLLLCFVLGQFDRYPAHLKQAVEKKQRNPTNTHIAPTRVTWHDCCPWRSPLHTCILRHPLDEQICQSTKWHCLAIALPTKHHHRRTRRFQYHPWTNVSSEHRWDWHRSSTKVWTTIQERAHRQAHSLAVEW